MSNGINKKFAAGQIKTAIDLLNNAFEALKNDAVWRERFNVKEREELLKKLAEMKAGAE